MPRYRRIVEETRVHYHVIDAPDEASARDAVASLRAEQYTETDASGRWGCDVLEIIEE